MRREQKTSRHFGYAVPNTPVEGYMVVRQTFSSLSMRLLTEESSSELVGTESMGGCFALPMQLAHQGWPQFAQAETIQT